MIKERLVEYIEFKGITKSYFEKSIKMGNGYISNVKSIGSDKLEDIINKYSDLNIEWLITGQGEMLKTEYNASRDNNINNGHNTGVIGNTGTVGNVGGNHVSTGDSNNIKKIMNEEGVSIEFAQSVESLQQTNAHLETRIKDLETINALQSKTIETMQLLIDTLTKKL